MMKTMDGISPAGESWSAGYVGEEKNRMMGTSGTDNDIYGVTRERRATFGVDAPGNPINVSDKLHCSLCAVIPSDHVQVQSALVDMALPR